MTDEPTGTNGEQPRDDEAGLDALSQAAAEAAAALGDAGSTGSTPEPPEYEPLQALTPPAPAEPTAAPPAAPATDPAPPPAVPQQPVPPETGGTVPTILADRFEVGELTGRTAMLETYAGRDRVLGTPVDIKFLSAQLATDPVFADRFVSEAQAAAAIDHPNIVKVLDAGDAGGQRYIVTERVEGQTLQQRLRRGGAMEAEEAAAVGVKVCGALQAAHDRGVIHRDINPGVVWLTAEGDVKVAEFGVARVESPQTVAQTRAIMGTAAYLSPEQAQGEAADARSDIYSTGVVCYEMIAGKPPFTADSPVAVAYMHVRDTPKPLAEVAAETPERVAEATMHALAKKPSERFQTAAEFAAALASPAAEPATSEVTRRSVGPETMVFGPAPGSDRGGLSTRTKVIIGIVAALLAIGALYAFLLVPRNVRVPTVINLSQTEAERRLVDAGLEVRVLLQESNENPAGIVFGQAPQAAQVVAKGTEVVIYVAEAPVDIKAPNVVGLTQVEAEAEIQRAGLTLGTVTQEASDTATAGTVLAQDPPAGTSLPGSAPVNITVALVTGPSIVPNVTCNTPDRAATIMDEAGLQMTWGGVETDANFSAICPQDGKPRVTQTNPPAGAELAAGAIVQFYTTVPLPSPTVPSPAAPVSPGASPAPASSPSVPPLP